MPLIVAAHTSEQFDQVRGLFRAYFSELLEQYRPADFEGEVSGLPGKYAEPTGTLLLATVSGQPAGCVGLRAFPLEGACEMKRLYVRPTFRGDALGRLLIERIILEARRLGYSRMRLDTHPPTMQSAVAQYRQLGFVEVDPDLAQAVSGLLYMELQL